MTQKTSCTLRLFSNGLARAALH